MRAEVAALVLAVLFALRISSRNRGGAREGGLSLHNRK